MSAGSGRSPHGPRDCRPTPLPPSLQPYPEDAVDGDAPEDGLDLLVPGAPGGEELRVFERIGGRGTRIFRSWQEEEEELARAAAKGQPLGEWEDRWQEGGMAEVEGAEGFVEGGDSVPD